MAEIAWKQHKITGKPDKSFCNSILVPSFRRIFVRANLLDVEDEDEDKDEEDSLLTSWELFRMITKLIPARFTV